VKSSFCEKQFFIVLMEHFSQEDFLKSTLHARCWSCCVRSELQAGHNYGRHRETVRHRQTRFTVHGVVHRESSRSTGNIAPKTTRVCFVKSAEGNADVVCFESGAVSASSSSSFVRRSETTCAVQNEQCNRRELGIFGNSENLLGNSENLLGN
jgi:hypothetical protein